MMESHQSFDKILRHCLPSFMDCFGFIAAFGFFFKNIKGALKQVRVTLCRTDVFHHCNRLLVRWSSKFDD